MSVALLGTQNFADAPIQEGDAGLILRKNGDFQIFNTHASIDPENLTDRQREHGDILRAFSLALQIPNVMELLKAMSNDPAIIGATIEKGSMH
jgi:hypothetical protein